MGECRGQVQRSRAMQFVMNHLRVDKQLCHPVTFPAQEEMRQDICMWAAQSSDAQMDALIVTICDGDEIDLDDVDHDGCLVPIFVEWLFRELAHKGLTGPERTRQLYAQYAHEFQRAYTPPAHT